RFDAWRAVPEHQRHKMVSGMRWTLWLSLVSAPCGYIATVLLARVGPLVVGTYGLLSLYIALTSVFLFYGGNGVVIKFLPELRPEERLSFFVSYFLVILGLTLPYQIAASVWPAGLQYVLGPAATNWFGVLLVWLAPLYILSSLVLASLKGLLEIKWSQLYNRIITLTTFGIYVVLYFGARSFLAAHYQAIIWISYLILALFVTVISLKRLLRLLQWKQFHERIHFFLPCKFWSYTSGLEASSVLNFLSTRLDYIFIYNAGGLEVFGRYVALYTLVSVIPTFATFVLDSFLPSLTNLLAIPDYESCRRITEIYLRFMLPCGMIAATFGALFVHFVFELLGPRYMDLVELGILAFSIAALQVLNWFVGNMFIAIGYPHRDAVVKACRTVIFCVAFWSLWGPFHLLGAILAWGMAEVSYQIIGIYALLSKMPFQFSFYSTYVPYLVVVCLASLASRFLGAQHPAVSLAVWLVLVGGFFLGARYSWREIRQLGFMVLPGQLSKFLAT
ncbi:MAG: lipopolysaccharide biosynthesis protein, partial [Candidatus Dormibacteria bacterium]